jgi:hypothetical protein
VSSRCELTHLKANFETRFSLYRLKVLILKPGSFKLWVPTGFDLYSPAPVSRPGTPGGWTPAGAAATAGALPTGKINSQPPPRRRRCHRQRTGRRLGGRGSKTRRRGAASPPPWECPRCKRYKLNLEGKNCLKPFFRFTLQAQKGLRKPGAFQAVGHTGFSVYRGLTVVPEVVVTHIARRPHPRVPASPHSPPPPSMSCGGAGE